MAESEDLELKRRAAPEGSEKRSQEADSRCWEGNRRVNGNFQFINQIGVGENHRFDCRASLAQGNNPAVR
jgi:hypothetical protein